MSNLIKRHHPPEPPEEEFKPTRMQRWIIRYVYETGRAVNQKEIEEEFRITRSTASTILGLMENRGIITRGTMKSDARQKTIMLTDKTRVICEQVSSHIEALEQQMVEGIDPGDLDVFFRVMHRIECNLSAEGQGEDTSLETERKN
ncbi:MAG: winged helix-turn-helix transcriptional regulator [Oscillospiraceae bacterium]|nr:winged helix-turn-helix transcriptional regulator [Oscillospiraceae bacterium]